MQIILLLLYALSNLQVAQFYTRQTQSLKEARRSSLPILNRHTKTFENDENAVLNTPKFKLIDSFLSIDSSNKSKPSVREHTTWSVRQISLNQNKEIAQFDSIKHRFVLHSPHNHSYSINSHTGQLTIINTNNTDLLHREITLHAETGLSQGDDILHDIYRLIRLSTTSLNCTSNQTIRIDQSIDIECSIEYEYMEYDDLNDYQPRINLKFYRRTKDSNYVPLDLPHLNTIEDFLLEKNHTSIWKRSIRYTIKPTENYREYSCVIIPDSAQNDSKNHRSCHTRIDIQTFHVDQNSSTVIITRPDQFDISIIILLVLSLLLCLTSFGLCIAARQYRKKRIIQIKPQNKTLPLPRSANEIVSNNNEIPSEKSADTSSSFRHKPGCPKYLPSSEYNLLSSDLFTHTTIDNIKKIILPDIPEPTDLFDDQTYIHFYIPSKSENISIKKSH